MAEGKSEEALKVLQQALEQSERTGVTAHEGMATNLIGNAYRARGQLDKAEEFYKKALDMAVSTGDSLRKGRALKCLGDVDSLKGNPSGALEGWRCSGTRRKLRDIQGVGYALQGTGRAEQSLGHGTTRLRNIFRRLLRHPNEAAMLETRLGPMSNWGEPMSSGGVTARRSMTCARESSRLSVLGDFKQVTQDLYTLGSLHLNRGQDNKAVSVFLECLEKGQKTKNSKLEVEALKGLGRVNTTSLVIIRRPWKIFRHLWKLQERAGRRRKKPSA